MALPVQVGDAFDAGQIVFTSDNLKQRVFEGNETTQTALSVLLQADPNNAGPVLIGTSTHRSYQLAAGKELTINISRLNRVYLEGPAGTKVSWLAVSTSGCIQCASDR